MAMASPRQPPARHSPNTFQVVTQWTLDTDSCINRPRRRPRERYVHPMASVLPHDTHTPPMGHHDHVRKPSVDTAAWIPNARADRCSSLPAPFSARNIQRRCTRVPAAADPAAHGTSRPQALRRRSCVDLRRTPTGHRAPFSTRNVRCTPPSVISGRGTGSDTIGAPPLPMPVQARSWEHYIHDAVLPRGSTHTRSSATSACSVIR
ncbi:hypothetical protein B0H13DRAFT_2652279 [Mycena leptocephala]|nr:hypothetical protein B0H13DRAFT_2652279 [Mycena leptocephala]